MGYKLVFVTACYFITMSASSFLFVSFIRHQEFFRVLFTRRVFFLWTVEGCPYGLSNEKAHGMNQVLFVARKS